MKSSNIVRLSLLILTFLTVLTIGYAQDYSESPMLAEQVAANTLPPVAERLPLNPLVIEPLDEIGTYGGTFLRGSAWVGGYLTENMTRETLVSWQLPLPQAGPPTPNLAERWEANADNTEITVYLREGIKWSDGEAFTSADVAFFWYDIMLDDNVDHGFEPSLLVDGETPTLEVIDDYTFKFVYPVSYFFFAEAMASIYEIAWPQHYMSQYHPTYNSDASYEDINAQLEWHDGRGRVTLQAFMLEEWVSGDALRLVRNPYYWKIDTAGNQLPYFDYAVVELVDDRQAVALGNVTGDFDMDAMWVGIQHLPLFEEYQVIGDYSVGYSQFPSMALYFNFATDNVALQQAYRDTQFRQAFSMLVDRQRISDELYGGTLQPTGSVFSPDTPFYVEDVADLWLYDFDAATAMLDEAGYVDVDNDGFRETPDGDKIRFTISVSAGHDLYVPSVEIIMESLSEAGLDVDATEFPQDLDQQIKAEGLFDIFVWDFEVTPAPWIFYSYDTYWHPDAINNSVSEEYIQFIDLISSAASMPYEERVATVREASMMSANNVWFINTGYYQRPFIINNRLGNAPEVISRTSEITDMPPFQAYQLFIRSED